MRWIIFAFLGAVLMVNGQEAKPNSNADKGQAATKGNNPPDAIDQTDFLVNQQTLQRERDSHSAKSPGYFSRLFAPEDLPNVALVFVGIGAVVVAIKSLSRIDAQIAEMRRQVDLTFGQLRAMHETLTEMSAQTDVLEKSVAATERNAEAAKASAESQITAERPWIVVSLRKEKSPDFPQKATIRVTLTLRNHGNTPAIIKTVRSYPWAVKKPEELAANPDYGLPAVFENERILAPRERWEYEYWDVATIVRPDDLAAILNGEKHFYYFGVVRYQDTFRPEVIHESRFCFKYFQRGDFFNVRGPSQYTKYT